MNEPMSDSYKKEVEEFKKWADNSLGRCEDFSKGISPRPRYERPYEPPMSPALKASSTIRSTMLPSEGSSSVW